MKHRSFARFYVSWIILMIFLFLLSASSVYCDRERGPAGMIWSKVSIGGTHWAKVGGEDTELTYYQVTEGAFAKIEIGDVCEFSGTAPPYSVATCRPGAMRLQER